MTATNMEMYICAPGAVVWTQKTDSGGLPLATPATPTIFAVLQDHNIEEKKSIKKLFGNKNRCVAVMHGEMDSSIDLKVGSLDLIALNSFYYGQTPVSGSLVGFYFDQSTGTPVPSTPFQITVTPPNSGVWSRDLGVIDAVTRKRLTPTTGSVTAGLYSVAAGVYTFSTGDVARKVLISYANTASVADSVSLSIYPTLTGPGVSGTLDIYDTSNTGSYRWASYSNVICSDYKAPGKQSDFMIHELKFEPFAVGGQSFVSFYEYNA